MPERRQAHRREPIEVEVRGEVLEAHPLPWIQRNEFGNAVIRQYQDIFNSALRSYVDPEQPNVPQIDMWLNDKLQDPILLLQMAFYQTDAESGEFLFPQPVELSFMEKLSWEEIRELLYAALDANDLSNLRSLIDPNSLTPTEAGGRNSSAGAMVERVESILKQPSTPDSSSSESEEVTSSDSPTEKSSTSSQNETESSGTSDSGELPSSSTIQ